MKTTIDIMYLVAAIWRFHTSAGDRITAKSPLIFFRAYFHVHRYLLTIIAVIQSTTFVWVKYQKMLSVGILVYKNHLPRDFESNIPLNIKINVGTRNSHATSFIHCTPRNKNPLLIRVAFCLINNMKKKLSDHSVIGKNKIYS